LFFFISLSRILKEMKPLTFLNLLYFFAHPLLNGFTAHRSSSTTCVTSPPQPRSRILSQETKKQKSHGHFILFILIKILIQIIVYSLLADPKEKNYLRNPDKIIESIGKVILLKIIVLECFFFISIITKRRKRSIASLR